MFLLSAFTSYAEFELPKYGVENLVQDKSDKELYLRAIVFDLKEQKLGSCRGELPWRFHRIDKNAKDIDLYKFANSPLFILRFHNVNYGGVDVVDFKVYTNAEKTKIKRVYYTNYSVNKNVNVGTLEKPVFKNITRILYEGDCY